MHDRETNWRDHRRNIYLRPNANLYLRPDPKLYLRHDAHRFLPPQADERKYSPNQPRVPAGNSDGGQWTSVAGNDAGSDTSDFESDRYLNTHIVDNHVGKTEEELKERIRKAQFRGLFATVGMDRNGSFESIESARDFIKRTLDNNPEGVASVASGRSKAELLTWRFGYETGREAYLEPPHPDSEIQIRKTYSVGVVIAHDQNSEIGYRVITAYPRNYNRRIGR